MKKNIFKVAALTLAGAFGLFSCGEETETVAPKGKPTVDVAFTSADYGVLNTDKFKVSATVSTSGDSAFINLSVNGTEATDAIYIKYQKDNDSASAWKNHPDGTSISNLGASSFDGTVKNQKFDKATNLNSFTYDVSDNINKAWKLTIPVKLRNTASAKSDVFTIWITKPGSGRFDNPAKNLAYGVAVVTFNYTNEKLVNYYATELGSSKNTDLGSLFSTSTGSNYKRAYAQDTLMGAGVDFVYNNYTSGSFTIGSFFKDATNLNADVAIGFKDYPATTSLNKITRVIKIKEVASTVDFSTIVGDASLSSTVDAANPTASYITYTSEPVGKVLAFITADGKKGLIKIVSINDANGTAGSAKLEVKVQR